MLRGSSVAWSFGQRSANNSEVPLVGAYYFFFNLQVDLDLYFNAIYFPLSISSFTHLRLIFGSFLSVSFTACSLVFFAYLY